MLIGTAIGAGFGLIYTTLVIDQSSNNTYVAQTWIGLVVEHSMELLPSL